VADVEPPGDSLDEFPRWNGGVGVVIPREVARLRPRPRFGVAIPDRRPVTVLVGN
jgi:hypothetical protein